MSIRAYITREKDIFVDEKTMKCYETKENEDLVLYTHTDYEYAFNVWSQNKLLAELFNYGAEDYTNRDYIGTIELGEDAFYSLLENSKNEWTEYDLKSIESIKNYFEENSWLILTTF